MRIRAGGLEDFTGLEALFPYPFVFALRHVKSPALLIRHLFGKQQA